MSETDRSIVVQVLDPSGVRSDWDLSCDVDVHDSVRIIARTADGSKRVEAGSDYYEALRDMRIALEAKGLKMLCVGARVDAYPSGILRDMNLAEEVYILKMGRQARLRARAWIFAPAKPKDIGTVDEQTEFIEPWLAGRKWISIPGMIQDFFGDIWLGWRWR